MVSVHVSTCKYMCVHVAVSMQVHVASVRVSPCEYMSVHVASVHVSTCGGKESCAKANILKSQLSSHSSW